MTSADTTMATELQTDLQKAGVAAGKDFAAGAGRSVFKDLGTLVEKGAEKMIRQCFRKPRKNVRPTKSRKVNVDFEVQIKDRLIALESKYQIPKKGSEAMGRLVEQIQLAAAAGREVVIFSGKELGPRALANRERMLRNLSGVDGLKVIGGFVEFGMWIAQEAAGQCL